MIAFLFSRNLIFKNCYNPLKFIHYTEKNMKQLFATTARGFEELLKVELTELGATECRVAQSGVHFKADKQTQYRALL